jgi:hypothetical protein
MTYFLLAYIVSCGITFFLGYRSGVRSVPKPAIPLDKLETMMADCFSLLDHIEGSKDWRPARQRFRIAEKAGFDVQFNLTTPEPESTIVTHLN